MGFFQNLYNKAKQTVQNIRQPQQSRPPVQFRMPINIPRPQMRIQTPRIQMPRLQMPKFNLKQEFDEHITRPARVKVQQKFQPLTDVMNPEQAKIRKYNDTRAKLGMKPDPDTINIVKKNKDGIFVKIAQNKDKLQATKNNFVKVANEAAKDILNEGEYKKRREDNEKLKIAIKETKTGKEVKKLSAWEKDASQPGIKAAFEWFVQDPARFMVRVANANKKDGIAKKMEDTPLNRLVFGQYDNLKDKFTKDVTDNGIQDVRTFGQQKKDFNKWAGLKEENPVGFVAPLAAGFIDTPMNPLSKIGRGTKTMKVLQALDNASDVKSVLVKTYGFADDVADKAANIIAKTQDAKIIQKAVNTAQESQKIQIPHRGNLSEYSDTSATVKIADAFNNVRKSIQDSKLAEETSNAFSNSLLKTAANKVANKTDEVLQSTKRAFKLDEVIDHPALFNKNPWLKNTTVVIDETLDGSTKGATIVRNGKVTRISLNPNILKSDKQIKETIMHEVQHMIDVKNGFDTGTDPDNVIPQIRSSLKKVSNQLSKSRNLTPEKKKELLTLKKRYESAIGMYESAIRTKAKGADKYGRKVPLTHIIKEAFYKNSLGEGIARVVAKRSTGDTSKGFLNMLGDYKNGGVRLDNVLPTFGDAKIMKSLDDTQDMGEFTKKVRRDILSNPAYDTVRKQVSAINKVIKNAENEIARFEKGTDEYVMREDFYRPMINVLKKLSKEVSASGKTVKVAKPVKENAKKGIKVMGKTFKGKEEYINDALRNLSPDTEPKLVAKLRAVHAKRYDEMVASSEKANAVKVQAQRGKEALEKAVKIEQPPKKPLKEVKNAEPIVEAKVKKGKVKVQNANVKKNVVRAKIVKKDVGEAPKGKKVRGLFRSAQSQENIPEKVKGKLKNKYYDTKTNDEVWAKATKKKSVKQEDELKDRIRRVVNPTSKEIAQGRVNLTDQDVADGFALVNKYYQQGKVNEASKLMDDMATAATEGGRGVQAYAMISRMTPLNMVKHAKKMAKDGGTMLSKDFEKEIFDTMTRIQKMPDSIDKAKETDRLVKKIGKLVPSTAGEKIQHFWTGGLLSGVPTHLVNVASTATKGLADRASNLFGAVFDMGISKFTGQRSLVGSQRGGGKGLKEGWDRGLDYLLTGFDPDATGLKYGYKEINYKTKTGEKIGKVPEYIFRMLGAEDKPFKYMAMTNSIYDQALVAAKNKGLKGAEKKKFVDKFILEPTEQAKKIAWKEAEEATFQNDTLLGDFAKSIQRVGNGKGRYIVPFGKTPGAVATEVLNYTPYGAMKEIGIAAKSIKKNGGLTFEAQRQLSRGLGKTTTGTALMALGGYLLDKNIILTGYPESDREAEQWKLEGKIPNSVLVNGEWKQLSTFGPAGLALALGANFKKNTKENGLTSAIASTPGDIGKMMTEQSFLKGASGILTAFSDPERGGAKFVSNMASSFLPTGMGNMARATDPNKAQREIRKDVAGATVDKLKEKTPGLRGSLPVKRDAFGDPLPTKGFWGENIDPFRSSKAKSTPVTEELRRLIGQKDANGKSLAATPTALDNKQTIAGKDITMTNKQLDLLEQSSSPKIKKSFESAMNTQAYQNASDEDRKKALDKIVDTIRSAEKLKSTYEQGLIDKDTAKKGFKNLNKAEKSYLRSDGVKLNIRVGSSSGGSSQRQDVAQMMLAGRNFEDLSKDDQELLMTYLVGGKTALKKIYRQKTGGSSKVRVKKYRFKKPSAPRAKVSKVKIKQGTVKSAAQAKLPTIKGSIGRPSGKAVKIKGA